ncbi:MAG: mannose-1-phosphate guanylyltransferase [Anaerolineae bacterium]|nr:NTP transferase domain-containing protein [Anaerolineales bacterium]MCQ3974399.1 mannose-1-phosphate guanyltransferase [Anaerolineae bacterium]
MFALILAGGAGTRLWPRSRAALPKQLLALTGGDTMMQATVKRVLPIVPLEHIFIATNREYAPLIRAQIPGIPAENIVEEPSGKNTAPCIGLAAARMRQLDPNAVMASLHADHFIADEEGFRQALLAAAEVAQEGYLVTLGITPDKPETGYGYIKRGAELGDYNRHTVYEVSQFLEKPDLATAERFVASGEYYWNSGIFIWQLSTLLDCFRQYMPEFYEQLGQMEQAMAAGQAIDAIWQQIQGESIDVGVMEKAAKVAVAPVNIGWNDVGSWAAIHEINQKDENGNVALEAEHLAIGTTGTLVQGNGRLIATIGLEDVVIVDSGDALLVCARDKVQDIKKVVEWLKAQGRNELL